jgi:hypothetical protein
MGNNRRPDGRTLGKSIIQDGKRPCTVCGEVKPLEQFSKHPKGMAGYLGWCKECGNAKARERYNKDRDRHCSQRRESKREYDQRRYAEILARGEKPKRNPITAKNSYLLRNYGITYEDYLQLLESQDHKCAICGTEESDRKGGDLVVDHCHASGKVRGMLCQKCNLMLGNANDLIGTLEQAVIYLRDKGEG